VTHFFKETTTMAKQKRIEGTYDEVPRPVQDAADEYVRAKRAKANALAKMNARAEELIDLMKEHDIAEVEIDDHDKRLTLSAADKLKIEKKKDAKDGETANAEE
jgi:hypothetical protein